MKTHAMVLILLTVFLAPGCFSSSEQEPLFVEDTRIEVRNGDGGRFYAVTIGSSNTTVVEAIWGPGEAWSIAYRYADTKALEVFRISVKTSQTLVSMDSVNPLRRDDGAGTAEESEMIPVNPALFQAMLKSAFPVIFIEGKKGRIIIETGTQSRDNLKALLDFAGRKETSPRNAG